LTSFIKVFTFFLLAIFNLSTIDANSRDGWLDLFRRKEPRIKRDMMKALSKVAGDEKLHHGLAKIII